MHNSKHPNHREEALSFVSLYIMITDKTSRFAEIKSLLKKDFALRDELISREELFGDYNAEMEALQTANGKKLESLIELFGWPDKEIDGEEAVKCAWYIVMHAISLPSLQRQVLVNLESNRTACLK